jgi:hypothetical protein
MTEYPMSAPPQSAGSACWGVRLRFLASALSHGEPSPPTFHGPKGVGKSGALKFAAALLQETVVRDPS